MTALTPAQVLERRRQVVVDQDVEGFVGLFAPDGVMELPFAGAGMPSRLEGQQSIRDFSSRVTGSGLRIDDLETVALYQTDDPEVVIVELATRATLTGTGRSFAAASVQIFRIRDGKIALFRDYGDPRGLQEPSSA
jgi:hypothetical protein